MLAKLRQAAQALSLLPVPAGRSANLCHDLEVLLALARDMIDSTHFASVERKWLQLYTDASLLLVWIDVLCDSKGQHQTRWLRAIRMLDMAIIVAGGVGSRRLNWIQDTIGLVQSLYLPTMGDASKTVVFDESPLFPFECSPFASDSIISLNEPPTLAEMSSKWRNVPLVIRQGIAYPNNVTERWTALDFWKSGKYLLSQVGEGRVVPVEIGEAYDSAEWTQAILPFRNVLAHIGFEVETDPDETSTIDERTLSRPWYLAQHTLFRQFPRLRDDFCLPDYVYLAGDDESGEETEEPIVNVWLGEGNGTVITPAHTVGLDCQSDRLKELQDPHRNCYAQVLGHKRVWLAGPEVSPHMKVYTAGKGNGAELLTEYMDNTSCIPILHHGQSVDDIRNGFLGFLESVVPQARETVLGPGDLLLLPKGWWHAMRSEGIGPTCSISMWY